MSKSTNKTKDDVIRVRVNSTLKKQAGEVFDKLGINYSEAFSLFLNQVNMRQGLPFDVKIPNKETLAAMKEIEDGKNLTTYDSVEAMFEDAKNW